jgi:hypothetical protein
MKPDQEVHSNGPAVTRKPSSLRCILPLGLFIVAAAFSAPSAQARDLTGRLGLGYNSEFANYTHTNGVPGISLKYGISRDIAVEGIVGVDTISPTNDVVGLKFFKNIFFETNLNFYFFAGGGIVAGDSKTGAEILSGFGAEWFFPGLESLGFSMDVGGELDNLSGNFGLKTLGVSFLNAGIHFYF